jgi:anti-sigma factor RsiW
MRCDEARDRIGPLLDGELANDERRALVAHAADCPDCARYRDELKRLRGHLAQAREAAPQMLLDRVRAGLAVETSAQETAPTTPRTLEAWPAGVLGRVRQRLRPYARQAAAVLVACVISIAGTWWWVQSADTRDALARDVLAAHVRALLQDNAVQIASLDTHTVKPWFAGRLEFAPVVKDLSAEGFQLVGGRLDYVGGRRVAALVYRRHLHQVSVFIWPAEGDVATPSRTRLDGYNLVSWHRAGMTFWAVSDLNEGELRELPALL